jgi:hypothetical protein
MYTYSVKEEVGSMRIRNAIIASSLLVVSVAAQAAVRYDFRQVTRSDVQTLPSMEISGRAVIDGGSARVDFDGRTIYGEKAFVISKDGGKKLLVADTATRNFVEINIDSIAQSLGASSIEITNLKTDVKQLPGHPQIAGMPTDYYRIEASYDISVRLGELPMTQTVHTVIDKWTTTAFGDVDALFLTAGTLRTGNVKVDEIIALESEKVKGLPLRQVTRITTSSSTQSARAGSKIQTPPHRTQISEFQVNKIEFTTVDPSQFVIPANYKRLDQGNAPQTGITTLTLQ